MFWRLLPQAARVTNDTRDCARFQCAAITGAKARRSNAVFGGCNSSYLVVVPCENAVCRLELKRATICPLRWPLTVVASMRPKPAVGTPTLLRVGVFSEWSRKNCRLCKRCRPSQPTSPSDSGKERQSPCRRSGHPYRVSPRERSRCPEPMPSLRRAQQSTIASRNGNSSCFPLQSLYQPELTFYLHLLLPA